MAIDGDTDAGACGECPGESPLCRDDGECVACLSAAECTTAEASVCDGSGACVICATDADCDHDGLPPACVAGEGCFECAETDAESSRCGAEVPVCDGATRSCRGCAEHSECAGGLCVQGQCPAEGDIVWVDKDDAACDDDGTGASDVPFCEIQDGLDSGAPYVAVRDSATPYAPIAWTGGGTATVVAAETGGDEVIVYQGEATLDAVRCTNNSTLTLQGITVAGTNSVVTKSGDGVTASNCTLTLTDVSVSGNGQSGVSATGGTVTLTDVSVSGNGGVGVSASAAADITIRRSTISDNTSTGLSLDGVRFDVENTVIGGFGAPNGDTGVTIRSPIAGSRFVNNSVMFNVTSSGNAAGVDCDGPFPVENSLLWSNTGNPTNDVRNCDTTSSSVDVDPMLAADRVHLTSDSTCCVDTGDDAAAPADDLDGDERPCGAGVDIGADELCP